MVGSAVRFYLLHPKIITTPAEELPWNSHGVDNSSKIRPVSTTKPVWTPNCVPRNQTINMHQVSSTCCFKKHGCGAPSSFSNANPKINCEDEQRCCPRFQSTSASGALRSVTAGEPPWHKLREDQKRYELKKYNAKPKSPEHDSRLHLHILNIYI